MSQMDGAPAAADFYDSLVQEYDLMVSWDARLAREKTFLLRVCAENRAASSLDAGCATGMHAIWFSRQGLRAAGADASPAMISRARDNARAAGASVDLRVAGFGELARNFPSPCDIVTCLGNSLPHLLDDASLDAALADFSAILSPGGALVIQNRNYDRLLREKTRFMPVTARSNGEDETLFLRMTDFRANDDEIVDFTIVTLSKRRGAWSQSSRTTPLRALRRLTLERALLAAGFTRLDFHGGYDSSAFDAEASADLLVVARR